MSSECKKGKERKGVEMKKKAGYICYSPELCYVQLIFKKLLPDLFTRHFMPDL